MNYQEALEWISSSKGWIDPYEFSEEHQQIYEYLLEKAVPKEVLIRVYDDPIVELFYGTFIKYCPNCKEEVKNKVMGIHMSKYCQHCGQAIFENKENEGNEDDNQK